VELNVIIAYVFAGKLENILVGAVPGLINLVRHQNGNFTRSLAAPFQVVSSSPREYVSCFGVF